MGGKARFRVYRTLMSGGRRVPKGPMHDADIVILVALLAPAFLAVFVWSALDGQALGAGPTVCGAIAVLAVTWVASAWRARGPIEPSP